jgi:transcriptional regulator with XRE-family HTH domain
MGDRPRWAQRLTAERTARGWSQADVIRAMRAHSTRPLPDDKSMLRNWKRWESGETIPDATYQGLIAAAYGTVAAAIWQVTARGRGREAAPADAAGLTTLEVITQLRASSVDRAALDALRITADHLCTEYPHVPAPQLLTEGRAWLRRISSLLGTTRLSLAQHREVLDTAGWLALLVGCVEYDSGNRAAAEATRKAALSLGAEAGNAEVQGWALEMVAWICLTRGDYAGVIAASDEGIAIAPHSGAAVQLHAQKAKAWARMGDRRQVEVSLDHGRRLLEGLPHPENLDHHFVVDPGKYDFYIMDAYRRAGEDDLAALYAAEVIDSSTGDDGTEHAPMRVAEARITQGIVAARRGELEHAVSLGQQALNGDRKSLPSLLMVSGELTTLLATRHPGEPEVTGYLDQVRALKAS